MLVLICVIDFEILWEISPPPTRSSPTARTPIRGQVDWIATPMSTTRRSILRIPLGMTCNAHSMMVVGRQIMTEAWAAMAGEVEVAVWSGSTKLSGKSRR